MFVVLLSRWAVGMGSRLKEDERNERTIRNLLKLPGNKRCINCNSLVCCYLLVCLFFDPGHCAVSLLELHTLFCLHCLRYSDIH